MPLSRFALVSFIGFASASCLRNFDQFSDGGVADSNTPHFEAPVTLCTESTATTPARIRIMNITGTSIRVCARANERDFALTNDPTQPEYADATGDLTPSTLASNHGVGFWLDSLDCQYPSYLSPLRTMDLTTGATYTLLVTENTFDGDGWRLFREADCVASGRMLVQIVNTTGLLADFSLQASSGLQTVRDVTGAGIDVSARPERSYVSLPIDGPAPMATVTVAPRGAARTFSYSLTLAPGRFVLAFGGTTGSDYRLVLCAQDLAGTTGSRATCVDVPTP